MAIVTQEVRKFFGLGTSKAIAATISVGVGVISGFLCSLFIGGMPFGMFISWSAGAAVTYFVLDRDQRNLRKPNPFPEA